MAQAGGVMARRCSPRLALGGFDSVGDIESGLESGNGAESIPPSRRGRHPNSRANLKFSGNGKAAEPVIDENPDPLTDRRHVYSGRKPKTFGQKEVLAWLKEDRKAFMARMTDLEKARPPSSFTSAQGGPCKCRALSGRPTFVLAR